jgi:twitching motility protein PilT
VTAQDDRLRRLAREVNSLGGEASLPPVARDPGGKLRLDLLLARAAEIRASDLLLVPGVPPVARVDGRLLAIDPERLDDRGAAALIGEVIEERWAKVLEERKAADFGFDRPGLGRYRCNVHHQRGSLAAAIRALPAAIPGLDALGLPQVLTRFAALERGLVLACGPAGCGKSTTLAAIVDIVNRTRNAHVITIEDPIEYVHAHGTSIVEQVEVGLDTLSFGDALRHALRQDPDVILVGEMRDRETIALALTAAETGHLVLSTLHTGTTAQTLDRIVDVFPEEQQPQVRAQLALSLAGIVHQQLLPRSDGPGRVPAVEVLLANDAVRNLVRRGMNHQIPAQVTMGRTAGMLPMDESLARLVKTGKVSRDEALRRVAHPDEFESLLR